MTALIFSYALLLRGGSNKECLLSLLSEVRRSEIEISLKDLEALSERELQLGLERHREQCREQQQNAVLSTLGVPRHELSPNLWEWLNRPFAEGKP